MASTPQFNTGQLAAARAQAWHQTGTPLLTLDAAREWIATAGLLLFAPRPQHLPVPAPSLVEATLGAATDAPTATQTDTARSLVARLVSEGNALPLNLLGGPGDVPDFIVSAQMFSFVFTLRGDKQWKQPPATSGSVKVSPLALRVYESLSERGAMTAQELASELGRELTENAVARALHELWTHLRVVPLLQQGEAATLWELTMRRFTKAIKAGTNAGQPTALSGLVSLYLSQALLATEEEIATFLSPLAPRSRIREVLHGLTAARQLEPVVLEGKTLLHVPGTLPEFPAVEEPKPDEEAGAEDAPAPASEAPGEGRIKRFTSERAPRSEFKGKPARSFDRKPAGPRPERSDRERRPFRREGENASGARQERSAGQERPRSFSRPWDEERRPRRESSSEERPFRRPREETQGDRPQRKSFGGKAAFRPDRSPDRRERSSEGHWATRPEGRREGFSPRPPRENDRERRPFRRREEGDAARPDRPRRNFAAGEGGRPPFRRDDARGGDRRAGGDRPFNTPRFERGERPERQDGRRDDRGGNRPGGFAPKRPFTRRDAEGGERPERPRFDRDRKPGARSEGRPSREGGERRPFRRPEGTSGERSGRAGGFGPGGDRPQRRSNEGKTSGGFSRRPGDKVPFGGRPGFGKRPAGPGRPAPRKRTPRPEEE